MNKFMKAGVVKNIDGSIISPHGGGLKLVLSTATTNGGLDCPTLPILLKKWSKTRESLFKINSYRSTEYGLGYVVDFSVQSDVWIMHLMCRDDAGALNKAGLTKCMASVSKTALYEKASVHVASELLNAYPDLSSLLKTELLEKGVDVYIYNQV